LREGKNVPVYDTFSFENTKLTDTTLSGFVDTLVLDSIIVTRLELKKDLTETLLDTAAPGDVNNLFNLWLQADSSAGKCDIYTDFVPHISNLFFIDDSGGFTPTSYGITCTTFSYKPGDITSNNVVNNVDLFYLAIHLFIPPNQSSGEEPGYNPELLNRIKSHRIFQSSPISSEEWDTTFSQILFRGDVNADSKVDVGDYYIMSRCFQGENKPDLEYGWSDPKAVEPCNGDTVRINFRRAYPGQQIPILIEIYNQNSLGGITLPLQIPDTTKFQCDSVTFAGRFRSFPFDWEWLTWDEDYDQDDMTQELFIAVSTLDTDDFPHIPVSDSSFVDSAFILWCTVKAQLDTCDYIECITLMSSHEISFFDTVTGHACSPHLDKFIADNVLADYGDAPDATDPYCAVDSYYFPTLCNTKCAKIEGRCGPYHQYTTECAEWLGSSMDSLPTQEWNAIIPDMDQDDLSDALYLDGDTMAWYIAPVTVTADTSTIRYLNVLYDINKNRIWENDADIEWVVQNKIIKSSEANMTERIIFGPFSLQEEPSSEKPIWARFTLTREPISPGEFPDDSCWDGSGPQNGWDYGETEDIPFKHYALISDTVCFSISSDSSLYNVPAAETTEVKVMVWRVSSTADNITGLTLNPYVFETSGAENGLTLSYSYAIPQDAWPGSFNLPTDETERDTIIFYYNVYFPDSPDARTSRVLWKVNYDLADGTKMVATTETEFRETAKPYFVFLNASGDTISWKDTTISYYGGVVDMQVFVADADSDYDIKVTFDREKFEDTLIVYPPIFGESKYSDTATVSSRYDPITFHWAADDTTDLGISTRTVIFTADETVGEYTSIEATLTIHMSNADSLLPPNKVWMGRTGVIAPQGVSFKVPVEVYNTDLLEVIELPFKIGDESIYTLDSCIFEPLSCRLGDTLILKGRTINVYSTGNLIDSVVIDLAKHPLYPGLSPGFGKILDLWFTGGVTCLQIDTVRQIKFWVPGEIDPNFETYEIRVIEEKGEWVCGDANGDNIVSIADVIFLVNYTYKSGPAPDPLGSGDANCDKVVNIVDANYIINYLFKGGNPPKQCDYGCSLPM
ncbi:MAG: dockerin type I repeat-containing protein, partial [Candidatus Zixiibacteriota bacterium]